MVLPQKYMEDELYLGRWLAANNWQLEEALSLLQRNLRWRKDYQVERIWEENWTEMEEQCGYQVIPEDKLGRPLLYIKLGMWDIRRMATLANLSGLGRYFTKMIEEADAKVWKQRAKGRNISQFTILVDLEGYSVRKHGCLHCLSFYSGLGETLQSHYPRVAERVVFINAPPMFETVFETVQRILGINARSSIDIFGKDRNRWQGALGQFLEPEQFPKELFKGLVAPAVDMVVGLSNE